MSKHVIAFTILLCSIVVKSWGLDVGEPGIALAIKIGAWGSGLWLLGVGLFWLPFQRYDKLDCELTKIRRKRATVDALGEYLRKLQDQLSKVSGAELAEFETRSLLAETIRLSADVSDYVGENVGKAESALFENLAECKWTPISYSSLAPDQQLTAREKQWAIDALRQWAIQLRQIIERRLNESVSDTEVDPVRWTADRVK